MAVAVAVYPIRTVFATNGTMIAILAACDRVTRKTAGHTTNHGTDNAVRGKAANQGASARTKRRAGIMGMAAAIVGGGRDRAGDKRDCTGSGKFGKTFHIFLLGRFGLEHERTTAAAVNRSDVAEFRQVPRRGLDNRHSLTRRRNRMCSHSTH